MIYRLFLFIIGSFRFKVTKYTTNTVNMLMRENIGTVNMHKDGDALVFDIPLFSFRKLKQAFLKYSLPFPEYEMLGFPRYLLRYKKRWGLLLGVISLFTIVYLSSAFVWQINIIGNETLEDSEITEDLKELGFGVGSFIPTVNVKLLCNEYLLQNDNLSWMSINIIGNCVDVRVREMAKGKEETESNDIPSVIVASCDGFIERIILKNGEIIRNVGSSVRKGETIITGVIESENGAFRLVRSEAEVYAKTTHSFTIEIPFEQTLTEEKESPKSSISLLFFSKLFALPGRGGKNEGSSSKITTEYLTLPGDITLPVGLVTRTFYKTEEKHVTLSENDAETLARAELAKRIEREFSEADILSISVNTASDGENYRLEVTIYCIENIAAERKIIAEDYKRDNSKK